MERGSFNKILAVSGISGLFNYGIMPDNLNLRAGKRSRIKPRRLNKGDTIGLIAPASPVSDEAFSKALKNMETLGFNYKLGDNCMKKYGYLAGDDRGRIDDIHRMFADPEVDAVWCIRGGYGVTRILNEVDYGVIRRNPKVFIGYSDITALHLAIHKNTGLVTFHGPVASSEFTDYTLKCFQSLLMDNEDTIYSYEYSENEESEIYKTEVIVPGKMEGKLVGGNLSLLASLAGTSFQLNCEDKIVFIEDIDEKPYSIDRMLTQLIDSSGLRNSNGILLGIFENCEAKPEEQNTLKLRDTLKDRLGNLGVPVYYGFSFGHIKNHCTFPVGIRARFDTEKQELSLLEKALL